MGIRIHFIVLVLLGFSQFAFCQLEFEVTTNGTSVVPNAQLSVFAAEASHIENFSVVPVPQAKPIWTGKANQAGKCIIPPAMVARGVLVMAESKQRLAFSRFDDKLTKIGALKSIELKKYRRMRVLVADENKRGADKIPVFMILTSSLFSRHLS